MTRFLILLTATAGYAGYSPVAPGTAGSAVGILIIVLGAGAQLNNAPIYGAMVFAALFGLSCWICGRAEQILGEPDSPRIVLDELMGMIATMYLNPLGRRYLATGFLLFRLFDIIKPPPAAYFDREVAGGAGVMLDDLVAAIYANLALRLVARLL